MDQDPQGSHKGIRAFRVRLESVLGSGSFPPVSLSPGRGAGVTLILLTFSFVIRRLTRPWSGLGGGSVEGAFQSLAGERGDAESTSTGGKRPVASPAVPPHPDPDTHAETSCLIPLAPGSPHPQHDQAHGILSRATASESAGITPDGSQCPGAQTRNHT